MDDHRTHSDIHTHSSKWRCSDPSRKRAEINLLSTVKCALQTYESLSILFAAFVITSRTNMLLNFRFECFDRCTLYSIDFRLKWWFRWEIILAKGYDNLCRNFYLISVEYECWHSLYALCGSSILALIHIHFQENRSRIFAGKLFEMRSNSLAGSAPFE